MILPGRVLREARERAGLTQLELAERLDVSQPVVARLESGRANPRLETLNKAIAATGHDMRVELERSGWPPIDETLIVGNRRFDAAERLRRFGQYYRGMRPMAGIALKEHGS